MKINTFAQHPAGFRVHFEIDDSRVAVEEAGEVMGTGPTLNKLLAAHAILTKWMVEHGYDGEYVANGPVAASGASPAPVNDNPRCQDCGSPTEFKQGKAKNGKAWAGWFCLKTKDAPKEQKHQPKWMDD